MALLLGPMEEILRTALSQCSQKPSPGFICGKRGLRANSLLESQSLLWEYLDDSRLSIANKVNLEPCVHGSTCERLQL